VRIEHREQQYEFRSNLDSNNFVTSINFSLDMDFPNITERKRAYVNILREAADALEAELVEAEVMK
jgi:hypothetical protein